MNERYRIDVTGPARRQLQRLPPRVAPAIIAFIVDPLSENPLRLSKPMSGELDGLRSSRRGEYRVLFEVDEKERTVSIVRIAHRAEAYRPR